MHADASPFTDKETAASRSIDRDEFEGDDRSGTFPQSHYSSIF